MNNDLNGTLRLEREQREYLERFADALDAKLTGVKVVRWKLGFWHAIEVAVDQVDLASVVASPSCVALRELTLRSSNPLVEVPPLLRALEPLAERLTALSIDWIVLRDS